MRLAHRNYLLNQLIILQTGSWDAEKVISIPSKKVEGWALPVMPGMVGLTHSIFMQRKTSSVVYFVFCRAHHRHNFVDGRQVFVLF